MEKKRLAKGIRKYIRKEKARLRREVFDLEEREKKIQELYDRFLPKQENRAILKSNGIKRHIPQSKQGKDEPS